MLRSLLCFLYGRKTSWFKVSLHSLIMQLSHFVVYPAFHLYVCCFSIFHPVHGSSEAALDASKAPAWFHLFTFLQVVCLALLWILKSTVAAIIFPVMVGDVLCLFQPHLCSVAWAFHTWAYSPMNTQIKSSNCKSPTSELHTPIIVLM